MGANMLRVSRRLGHSTVQITADVYGHLFRVPNDLAIGRLDKALRAALPHPTVPMVAIDDVGADAPFTTSGRTDSGTVRSLRPGPEMVPCWSRGSGLDQS
jgi:hypothetical protein